MYKRMTAELFEPIEKKYQLAECPVWDEREQVLWWVDIPGQQLLNYNWSSGQTRYQNLDKQIGMVRLCDDDCQVIGQGGQLMLRQANGTLSPLLDLDIPEVRFNDGAGSPDGRLFVGTMRYDGGKGGGNFYRIDKDKLTLLIPGVTISNGLAWSVDSRFFYYIDSPTKKVDMFDYDPENGEISHRRTAFSLGEYDWGVPDGMCRDDEGRLWVAIFGENSPGEDGRVICIDPVKNEICIEVKIPFAKRVTSCTFAGPLRDTLIITTSFKKDFTSINSGRLFMLQPGVTGSIENRWIKR